MTERRGRTGRHPARARVERRPGGDAGGQESGDGHVSPGWPSEDAIRTRAYELYLERGAAVGHELEDWLAAERALRAAGPADAPPA